MKLCLPEKILEQHAIWLGKTGAGKSSSMRHVVEWLLSHNHRLCIIDPKGDWYGLKASADGKSAGFKVILFGDFKDQTAVDVPINDRSGKHIAELIASGNRPCVIGMRGWSNAAQSRFWIDFASSLFNSNLSGGLKLFVDEVQNFAPKERTGIGQENEALFWTKKLLSEGRGLGLTIFCGSQRPASVHNGVLTQCETLVAMRVIHSSDRKASKEWIDGNGDKELGQKVLDSLAGLSRGEAYVWSPEAEFGPERVQFPMFTTFDSFAPPQLQKKISTEGWSTVNLDDVKAKLASVIEEAKANDPTELKREIARLKKEISVIQKSNPAEASIEIKEVPVFSKAERDEIRSVQDALTKFQIEMTDKIDKITAPLFRIEKIAGQKFPADLGFVAREKLRTHQQAMSMRAEPPARRPVRTSFRPPQPNATEIGELPKGPARILNCLIQFPNGLNGNQLTVLSGYTRRTRDSYIQILRERGYSDRDGESHVVTDAGKSAMPDAEPLPTGEALQNHWLQKLPQGERRCFEVLLSAYPNSVSKEALSEQTGYTRRTRDSYLYSLRARELFTEPQRGEVRAVDQLFE